jgi:hypothetical protein
VPLRSFAIRCSACAGLYAAGRGLRMTPSNCDAPPVRLMRRAASPDGEQNRSFRESNRLTS